MTVAIFGASSALPASSWTSEAVVRSSYGVISIPHVWEISAAAASMPSPATRVSISWAIFVRTSAAGPRRSTS